MITDLENPNLEELIVELKRIGTLDDRMERSKEVENIKSIFYKQLGKLKSEAEAEGSYDPDKFTAIEEQFKTVYIDYKRERAEFNKEQEAERQANLEKKLALIEELKQLVDNSENVQAAFPTLHDIQTRWKEIGPVPASEFNDVNKSYKLQEERFYDMVQINHELRDLDFKKNLEAKEELCKQAEELAQSDDVVSAFNTLQILHEKWKDLGPVAKEYRESIWDRFKAATAVIRRNYQEHFERLKAEFAANLNAKQALCEEVEKIADMENISDAGKWNDLSKEIENIQAKWKTIGFASRKDNQKIYERFRAACDKFFEKKRVFFMNVKSDMEENIAKKESLIAQAENLKNSEEWKKTTDQFIALQKQWKEIGAVPRKKSEQLWKRFRAACDEFFASRDAKAKSENDYYSNLKAKRALIEEIRTFKPTEEFPASKAKEQFANRYKEIGFVPFKEKDNIAKAYKEAMDEVFPPVYTKNDLMRKYNALQQDIITYENNIGFFSNSRNSEALVSQMRKRIAQAKEELKAIEEKIRSQK